MKNIKNTKELISLFYDTIITLPPKKQMKEIELYTKRQSRENITFLEYISENKQLKCFADAHENFMSEINRFFYDKSKIELQRGMILECAVVKAVANRLKLFDFVDIRVGDELPSFIFDNIDRLRYVYYDKDNNSTYILQYGDSKTSDILMCFKGEKIVMDIKDIFARFGDMDAYYSNDGKIILNGNTTYDIAATYFNNVQKDGIYGLQNQNFYIRENSILKDILIEYFTKKDIDAILTIDRYSRLVIIFKEDIENIINITELEIRSWGKNLVCPFHNERLQKWLSCDNIKIDGDTVIVSLKESYTQNDIKLEYSKNRCRIGDKFVVKERNIIKENRCVKFRIKHIKQAKTVMTIKGKCKMKYGEIRDYYLSQK